MKVLANDGISKSGIDLLEKNGFEVEVTKVAQEQLPKYINENNELKEGVDGLLYSTKNIKGKDIIAALMVTKVVKVTIFIFFKL